MRWREAALALHAAGIQVHSGTIPVERLWSNIGKYFPKEATSMSEEWSRGFVSNLAYLRFNYRHFHKQGLPPWAREDALVHEHVESIMKIAEAMVFPASPGHSLAGELDAWVQEVSAQAARSGDEESLVSTTPLYCRILQPIWCDALACGHKMFEAQKYRGARTFNVFKFAAEGVMFLFGEAGSSKVAGAALLAGPASSNVSDGALQLWAQSLPPALQTPVPGIFERGCFCGYC